jgi:hypothetical protein
MLVRSQVCARFEVVEVLPHARRRRRDGVLAGRIVEGSLEVGMPCVEPAAGLTISRIAGPEPPARDRFGTCVEFRERPAPELLRAAFRPGAVVAFGTASPAWYAKRLAEIVEQEVCCYYNGDEPLWSRFEALLPDLAAGSAARLRQQAPEFVDELAALFEAMRADPAHPLSLAFLRAATFGGTWSDDDVLWRRFQDLVDRAIAELRRR